MWTTAIKKKSFPLFCSNFLGTRTPPFSLLLNVIGTFLPALVINNQVISMPRSLLKIFQTSDVVRVRASFHTYWFSYVAVLQRKQQDSMNTLFWRLKAHLGTVIIWRLFKCPQAILPTCMTPAWKSQPKVLEVILQLKTKEHARNSNLLFSVEPPKAERQSNVGLRRITWCKVRCGIKLQHCNLVIPSISILIW